jgi:hypothetical protein
MFRLQVNVPVCISGVSSAAAADVIKEFTDKVSEAKDKEKKKRFFKSQRKKVQNVLRVFQCSEKDKT